MLHWINKPIRMILNKKSSLDSKMKVIYAEILKNTVRGPIF